MSEVITYELIRERVLESVAYVQTRHNLPDDQMDSLHEDIESWDWLIYNNYIHQILMIGMNLDDHYIEMIQLNCEMDVADVKHRVAYEFVWDLAATALMGGKI